MLGVKRVSPEEASRLMEQGHVYVDVRTEQEFALCHPAGALNVPLDEIGPNGLRKNPDFLPGMQRLFSPDSKIIVGCATGVRSLFAARLLITAGFSNVVDQRAGLDGSRTPFGAVSEKGWVGSGLPVERGRARS
jgi:rhodanese-related sulfurtransferase